MTPTAHFSNDLGLDSLDAVEVCMALEEEFGAWKLGAAAAYRREALRRVAPLDLWFIHLNRPSPSAPQPPAAVITIPDAEAEKILSVEDAVSFVATHPQAK